ncbi:MAG TPA: carboxypeptidase-like regulatory domain-containing protein [Pyrinomonadaceae bacterium]
MNTALKLFSFLLLTLVVFSVEARACSCAGSAPPCEAYWRASAVFVGQVVGVSNVRVEEGEGENKHEQGWRAFRFAVERPLRGVADAYVEVLTGGGGGDCGYGFERGGRYIIYAYRDEKTQRLYTGICSRTQPVAEAGEDLRYIDGLSQGPPAGGAIYGQVLRARREKDDEGSERDASVPVSGAKIEAAGKGKTFRAETDAEGKYRFGGLPPGEYVLKLDLPKTLMVNEPERKVRIDERGCAVASFYADENGRLSGRVFDAAGRPASRVSLQLSAAESGEQSLRGPVGYATTDAEGRYEVKGIPPGRYIIRIRFDGEPTASRPFPVLYHENVTEAARARVVQISEGEHVEDYDIRLPPLPGERVVSGVVVWPDGQPAAGVTISYTSDIPNMLIGDAATADEAGRFSFKVYEGIGMKLSVSVNRADGSWVNSNIANVPATGAVGEIRIVVPRP